MSEPCISMPGSHGYNDAAVPAWRSLPSRWGWTIADAGHSKLRAVPQITKLPRVGAVPCPHALTNANVRGGPASTRGCFYLAKSPRRLGDGLRRVRVIFRPTDTAHYTSTGALVPVRVYSPR
jgi:hypothetical protein